MEPRVDALRQGQPLNVAAVNEQQIPLNEIAVNQQQPQPVGYTFTVPNFLIDFSKQYLGRCILAYPALLALQAVVNNAQNNSYLFSNITELLLKVGSVGQSVIGFGEDIAANIGQMHPFGAIGLYLTENILEDTLENVIGVPSLISKPISIISCAAAFSAVGFVPTFATGVALLLTAKVVGLIWDNIIRNSLSIGLHFGIGYGTTVALQAASNTSPWLVSLFGELGPQIANGIASLNPLYVAGMFSMFAIVDSVAKKVLVLLGQDQVNTPEWSLIRITGSVLATSLVATSLGLATSLTAATVTLSVSIIAYKTLTEIAFRYNNNRYAFVDDHGQMAVGF